MDDIELLEAELRGLPPRAPSPALERRIQEGLNATPRRSTWWWLGAVAMPLAAAVVIAITAVRFRERADAPAGMLKPVSAENVLYAVSDEGTLTLNDGTTARRQRLQYLDTIHWTNPRTHASLTWTVPREEVRVTPLSYQ